MLEFNTSSQLIELVFQRLHIPHNNRWKIQLLLSFDTLWTVVPSVHKVSKQLAELQLWPTVTTTASVRQCHCHLWSNCCQDQERKQQQQTQTTRNLLKVCSQLFIFFLVEVLPSEIVEAVHWVQSNQAQGSVTVLHVVCTVLHCQHRAQDPLYSAAPASCNLFYFLGFTILPYS